MSNRNFEGRQGREGRTHLVSEGISKEIKNSNLFIIKNAKHGATIEQANVVNEKINSFLY